MAIYDQVDQLVIGAAGVIRIMPVDPSSGAAILGLAPADIILKLTPCGGTPTLVMTQASGGVSIYGTIWTEVPTMASGGSPTASFYTLGFQAGTYAYYSLVAGPMLVSVFRVSDLALLAQGEVIVMAATDADALAANASAIAAVAANAELTALYLSGQFRIDPTSGAWTLYDDSGGTLATGTMYTSADGGATWTASATNILQRCKAGQTPL